MSFNEMKEKLQLNGWTENEATILAYRYRSLCKEFSLKMDEKVAEAFVTMFTVGERSVTKTNSENSKGDR